MNKKRNANIFFNLTKRHLIVFFRSKITVLYTLIVPVIVLGIYILFLRELEISSVRTILQDLDIKTNNTLTKILETVIDSWMLSGICAVTSVTVSIQTNYIFVRDNPDCSECDIEELKNSISKNGKHFYGVIFRNSLIIMLCFYLINIILGM